MRVRAWAMECPFPKERRRQAGGCSSRNSHSPIHLLIYSPFLSYLIGLSQLQEDLV